MKNKNKNLPANITFYISLQILNFTPFKQATWKCTHIYGRPKLPASKSEISRERSMPKRTVPSGKKLPKRSVPSGRKNKKLPRRSVPSGNFYFILRILYSVSLLIEILIVEQFLMQLLQRLVLMYHQMQYLDL